MVFKRITAETVTETAIWAQLASFDVVNAQV